MSEGLVLLVDLDGHDMTMALASPGAAPHLQSTMPCRSLAELETAVRAHLEGHGVDRLVGAAFSAAGPLVNDAIKTTSGELQLSLPGLRQIAGTPKVYLLNDLAALAMGVARAPANRLVRLSEGDVDPRGTVAVIGVGLGLGVAGLVALPNDNWRAIPSEAGHMDCAAREDREVPVFELIRHRRGDTTAERLLSRSGLVDIHGALTASPGDLSETPEAIVDKAHAGDAAAREAISIFSGVLGAFARDIALNFAARGGVFINSPMLTAFGDLFDRAAFARRFEAAGMMTPFVKGVRVSLVPERPVLLGLSSLFSVNDRVYRSTEVAYLDC